MRVVVFAGRDYEVDDLFLYLYARIAESFPDTWVVAVCPRSMPVSPMRRALKAFRRKLRLVGLLRTLEIVTSYPLQRWLGGRDQERLAELLRNLPRPAITPDPERTVRVTTTNGPDAIEALTRLAPDVLVQAGAPALLKACVFSIPRLGAINMHHGIAPAIRGMNSIYWGLWERRPDWLGATIHVIDEGIDTGPVLAYAPVRVEHTDDGFPELFARATALGVTQLIESLTRLAAGECWRVTPAPGESTYRSTFSGWRLGGLALRRWIG